MLKRPYNKIYQDWTMIADQPSVQNLPKDPIRLLGIASYLPWHLPVACEKVPCIFG